ncbi:hypothetical protein FRC12_010634 [Ceratobasidium sp. 428]|nr:hypothetical protein FRC12_010634 [Ceratobasidium sp. 428]
MCNAQGAIQTIGETAVAFATILVAVYTSVVIYLNQRPAYSPWYCLATIVATWLWAILWGVVPIGTYAGLESDGHGARLYYTPTPWWVGTICLYVPSYIVLRKNRRKPKATREPGRDDSQFDNQSHSGSSSSIEDGDSPAKILYYPIAYTLCILPLSIMRWATFRDSSLLSNSRMHPPSMVFSVTFYLMGSINVALTVWVRPSLLLIRSDGQLSSDDPRFVAETQVEAPDIIQPQQADQTGHPESNSQRLAVNTLAGWNT